MATVSIDAGDFPVYADIDTADVYLGAALHAGSWDSLGNDDETKGRALVTATRLIDRQPWVGEKTGVSPAQALAWPRSNTGITGVDADVVPDNIVTACMELALALVDGSEVQNQQTTAERIRSMSAGSVSISNFRGIDNPTRFPQIVQELLSPFLGGSSPFFVSKATGVDGETIFPVELGFGTGGI